MRHTEEQLREALRLVRMPDHESLIAFATQLRRDDPSAWFIVAGARRRYRAALARDTDVDGTSEQTHIV